MDGRSYDGGVVTDLAADGEGLDVMRAIAPEELEPRGPRLIELLRTEVTRVVCLEAVEGVDGGLQELRREMVRVRHRVQPLEVVPSRGWSVRGWEAGERVGGRRRGWLA